jgi:hypothetical protein
VLDLSSLLKNLYGSGNGDVAHVRLSGSGSNVIVEIDVDTGAGTNWQDVTILSSCNTPGNRVNIVLNEMETANTFTVKKAGRNTGAP